MLNRIGPKIEPSGTPLKISRQELKENPWLLHQFDYKTYC